MRVIGRQKCEQGRQGRQGKQGQFGDLFSMRMGLLSHEKSNRALLAVCEGRHSFGGDVSRQKPRESIPRESKTSTVE
jgi:hypothetical protein